jgi:hypothetical protein
MLAMDVSDDAGNLMPRGVFWFFASMLAPTRGLRSLSTLAQKKRHRITQ